MIYIVSVKYSEECWVTSGEFENPELAADLAFDLIKLGWQIKVCHVPIIEGESNVG